MLIQVHAAAVTPTEFAWYPTFHTPEGNVRQFPIVLGHEFSGVVAAIGDSNRDMRMGDSVYGLNDWFMDGAQAEYCLAAAASVAPTPATVDHTLIEIGRLIDSGVIHPIMGAVFPMDEVRRAYAEKPTRGKNVLRIAEG